MNRYITSKILLLLLILLGFVACNKSQDPNPSDYISLRFDVDQVQTRASSPASNDEKQVTDLMVLFFDKNTGAIFKTPYLFNATQMPDNGMLIPLTPGEVNEKRVVVIANYKEKGNLEAELMAVDTYDALKGLLYESATNSKAITAPGLLMEGEVVHTFTTTARVAVVPLRRAVAKLSVKLYLNWEALDARFPTTEQPDAFNLYQLRDVSRDTYLQELDPKLLTAANRSERYNDNPAHPEYLWNFAPHTDRKGPLEMTAYLNEYNQGADAANVPPYLYLKLHANVPESNSADPEGELPPPAGGDVVPAHEADFYYRLLLPRQMKRNSHYIIEAQILSAGSADADKPLDITPVITVVDWTDVEYVSPGEPIIYN